MKKCPYCAEDIQDAAILCRYCGKDLAPVAAARPPRVVRGVVLEEGQAAESSESSDTQAGGLNKPVNPLIAIIAVAIVGVLIWAVLAGGINIGTDGEPPVVTMAEYARLSEGMTYDQAVQTIGASGVEQSRSELAGITTVMYMWQNRDGGNMNAMFQNNRLVTKAQFGLK